MDEILMKAAENIENNWAAETYMSDEGGCLIGHLLKAKYQHIDFHHGPLMTAIEGAGTQVRKIAEVIPVVGTCCNNVAYGFSSIVHYNDVHCEGGIEAAKILREAAEVEL